MIINYMQNNYLIVVMGVSISSAQIIAFKMSWAIDNVYDLVTAFVLGLLCTFATFIPTIIAVTMLYFFLGW